MSSVSDEELRQLLGDDFDPYMASLAVDRPCSVADWRELNVGDVIFTSMDGAPELDWVAIYQAKRGKGALSEWSHVMMYLGGGVIVESNPSGFEPNGTTLVSGPRFRRISSFTGTKMAVGRPLLTGAQRARMVSWAYTHVPTLRNRYPLTRVWETVTEIPIPFRRRAQHSVICTDLVLQVLAFGALALVERFNEHQKRPRGYMPADMLINMRLFFEDVFPMPLVRLEAAGSAPGTPAGAEA